MKIVTISATTLLCSTMLLAGCEKKSATADLDRVLGVTSDFTPIGPALSGG
jgi:uncharacterized lipoprotein YajG